MSCREAQIIDGCRCYGFRDLENKATPFAGENNRVEIVNLSSAGQMQK